MDTLTVERSINCLATQGRLALSPSRTLAPLLHPSWAFVTASLRSAFRHSASSCNPSRQLSHSSLSPVWVFKNEKVITPRHKILWPPQKAICLPSSKNTALTFWYELLVEISYVECLMQRTVAKIDSPLEKLSSFRPPSKPREARKPTLRLFFYSDPPSFIHRHQIDYLFPYLLKVCNKSLKVSHPKVRISAPWSSFRVVALDGVERKGGSPVSMSQSDMSHFWRFKLYLEAFLSLRQ